VDSDAIAQLRALAAEARETVDQLAAGDDVAAEERYRGLQSRAAILNAEYQWASPEEFETLFPTADARREMAALNQQYGEQYRPSPIDELLIGLWAWARGVLVPYEQGLD
jgi:hypothetical protein